jgi:lipoyl(octanoyl) transferase
MINKKEFRLILTNINDAKMNMAIDKALSISYEKDDMPILRFYTWENSFTVGLGQDIEHYDDLKKIYKDNYSKRITGGGVLFHGHDISYSLVLSNTEFGNLSIKQSYEKICQFLLEFYKNLGLNPSFVKDSEYIKLKKNEFCQVGFEAYDIIVNGNKIGGNAQKRNKKLIFQHGSVPIFKTNEDTKMGISLEDFEIHLSFEEAQNKLIKAFEKCFDAKLILSQLTQIENENLNKILEGK